MQNTRIYECRNGGHGNPTTDNIHLAQSWIVSQYKHEYNPFLPKHSGNFSGVCYLKLPEDMENHFDEETKDHYPASGLIEFSYGEPVDMRSDTLMFKTKSGYDVSISILVET